MGVALPELPDDRRAQPRRREHGDGGPAARHSRDVPPGRHAAPAPDGLPGRPWPVDGGHGRRGLPIEPPFGSPPPVDNGEPPANGRDPRSGPNGGFGYAPTHDPSGLDGGGSAPGLDPYARNGHHRHGTDGLPGRAPTPAFNPRAGDRGLDDLTGLVPGGFGLSTDRNGDGGRSRGPAPSGDLPGRGGPAQPDPRAIRADEIAGYGPGSYGDPSAQPPRPLEERRPPRYPDGTGGYPPPTRTDTGPRPADGASGRPPTARPAVPADDDTISMAAVPPVPVVRPESDVPPPRRPGAGPPTRSSFLQKPVQRPAADEDPPTVALRDEPPADVPDDDAVPGRHRRRAGEPPDGRPSVDYRAEAAAAGHPTRGGRRRRPAFWKELPILVVVALLLTFLIQTFVAKVYVIPSGSMETTLHGCAGCTNDRVLVDKVGYRFSDPRPGDVVVFRGPDGWTSEFTADQPSNVVVAALQQLGSLVGLAPPDEKDFIKRVIAVGGQTVQCCDSRNRVLVNDKPLDEPYIYYLPEAGPARQDSFGPVTVPAGSLWMMGDSRNNSADSRVAGHGAVPVSDVIGKAQIIVLPFARFGSIPDTNPQTTPVGMGGDAGAPLALGLVGVLPLVALRRRRGHDEFLP